VRLETIGFLSASLCVLACKNRSYNEKAAFKHADAIGSVTLYPPDPKVHVDDKSLNPLDRGSFKPSLLQKDAVLRYAMSLAMPELDKLSTPEEIQKALSAASSRVEADAAIAASKSIETMGSAGSILDRAKILQTEVQLNKGTLTAKDVCQAVLLSNEVSGPAASTDLLRVWLTACQSEVLALPKTLDAFKEAFGDFKAWPSELHPKSLVLHGGRRFYRSTDLRIRVAEGLAEDCSVTGTEGEMKRDDGTWIYFAYNVHGQLDPESKFPGVGGRVIEHLTPDSCLGCHGTFDSRRFNVPVPSYQALRLTSQLKSGKFELRDASKCRKQDEPMWSAPELDGF
jgi:hypothetical protein